MTDTGHLERYGDLQRINCRVAHRGERARTRRGSFISVDHVHEPLVHVDRVAAQFVDHGRHPGAHDCAPIDARAPSTKSS